MAKPNYFAIDPEDALVPIFAMPLGDARPRQVGTGIFVDLWSQPFLLTAAHVTDELQTCELMVPLLGSIHKIEGYFGWVDLLPENLRQDDSTDVAYCRLDSRFASALSANFKPLPQTRCENICDARTLGVCSVYGYPASKAKFLEGIHSSETASYRGVAADEEVYKRLNVSSDQNLVVHFSRKRAISPHNGRPISMIGPKGISGGGIFAWPMGHEFSQDWSLPKLVGVIHTYKKADGLFIGTSLQFLLSMIKLGEMKGFGGIV